MHGNYIKQNKQKYVRKKRMRPGKQTMWEGKIGGSKKYMMLSYFHGKNLTEKVAILFCHGY